MFATKRLIVAISVLCTAGPAAAQTANPSGVDGAKVPFEETLRALRQLPYQSVTDSEAPAPLTLTQLRDGQVAWRERIKSLKVAFLYEDKRVFETAFDLVARTEGQETPEILTEQQIIAVKDEKFYREVEIEFRGMVAKQPDAHPKHVVAFNGTETRRMQNFQLAGDRTPGVDPSHRMAAMKYGRLAYLPLGPDPKTFMQSYDYVPTALDSPDVYHLKPTLEVVDGRPCHLVRSGHDAMWIDHAAGFCLRRRVHISRTGRTDPGCLSLVQMCSDLTEVVPGIWLPKTGVSLQYTAQRDPESARGKVGHIHTVKASKIEINTVPDSLFEPTFEPGYLVLDKVEKKAYHMPHGEESLERAIAEGLPIVDGKVIKPGMSTRRKVLLITSGVLLVVFIGIVVARRSARARRIEAQSGPK
jgi:hypothetical protein